MASSGKMTPVCKR